MRVAIIGVTGQLGGDLADELRDEHEVIGLGHAEVEVADGSSLEAALGSTHVDAIVNCAARHRVDDLESDPQAAFEVNAIGALHVARAAETRGAACVYVSTDYVFDGDADRPYTEDDAAAPVNVYGVSKLAGEVATRSACSRSYVVRVASLFGARGASGKGGNFVETILARVEGAQPLSVVDDIVMSPTYTRDAARALRRVLDSYEPGTYHLSNSGSCSWHAFASEIVRRAGYDAEVAATDSSSYASPARRPPNSAMRTARLRSDDVPRPWKVALGAYLAETGRTPTGR